VKDVAVIGLPDPEFGECIVAILVLKETTKREGEGGGEGGRNVTKMFDELDGERKNAFRIWCGERLSPYKVPRRYLVYLGDSLPRNALEKVSKKDLKGMVQHL